MKIKQKKGISLIVLVITIIVMIILATAIILALNGSGIIGKAGEAREASDNASKKQAAILKLAEYELALQNGEISSSTSINTWVKNSLNADGVDTSDMYITEDREILVGLTKIAVSLLEAGVPIGATVTGYDVSANETSYETDGTENSLGSGSEATAPQPQTVQMASKVEWTYMGVSDDGEALIVMNLDDLTATYSSMTLGGKKGYLNGVDALNKACKALYSTDKGTARSINYEDVLKVLKYNGPQSQYTDETVKVIKTNNIPTVGELVEGSTRRLSSATATPDGKDIKTYKADYLMIRITNVENGERVEPFNGEDLKYVKADLAAQKVIFIPEDINYWIADTSVNPSFDNNYIEFGVRRGNNTNISAHALFRSVTVSYSAAARTNALRPVVELKGDLTYTYDSSANKITLN